MRIEAVAMRGFAPFADTVHQLESEAGTIDEFFGNVIRFPEPENWDGGPEIHLLTGANGTGKTRLLCLLAAACGNANSLELRDQFREGTNQVVVANHSEFRSVWMRSRGKAARTARLEPNDRQLLSMCRDGEIRHLSHWAASIIAASDEPAAAIAMGGLAIVDRADIDSDPLRFSPEDDLAFEVSRQDSHAVCQGMAFLKIAATLEASRNPDVASRSATILQRVEQVLSDVTGREFRIDATPPPNVQLRIVWGDVAMDVGQLPDGLRRLLAWIASSVVRINRQFPEHPDPLSLPLVMLIDEPENHLHPAWQRKILPAALKLFPHAQMFLATHSPFVISSANSGWVYILQSDETTGAVTVEEPIPCSEGDSYLEVVNRILGVSEWYDIETEALLKEFREMRNDVVDETGEFDELMQLATKIASRSRSLEQTMSREIRQVERLLGHKAEPQ